MLRDSVVVVRTRPQAIPLAMITMRKSTRGFPYVSHILECLWGSTWWPFGPPELRSYFINFQLDDTQFPSFVRLEKGST